MLGKSAQTSRLVTRNAPRVIQGLKQHGRESTHHCAAFSSTSSKPSSNKEKQHQSRDKREILKRNQSDTNNKMIRTKNDKALDEKLEASGNGKSTLSKCNQVMSKLLQRRQELPTPPIDWLYSQPTNEDAEDLENKYHLKARTDLYKDILSFIQAVELSIKSKRIQASSGRDIREVTALLGNILLICSESPPKRFTSATPLPSTSQSCTKVLSLLNELNLDIQHIHNFCTIRAANQEHEWKLASTLFHNQIDPDFHGLVPVDPRLGWDTFLEMGLFGLAMNLSERGYDGVGIVEGVLDAVRDMCMVSPTDREKYVMAAGIALGRSGQWKACIDYMSSDPKNISEFGQPLFAAMMNACYICENYDSVLDLYYSMQQDSQPGVGDWQWGGEYARSHPLCTDLLLRSVGMRLQNTDEKYQGFSEGATLTFHQLIEQGGRISLDAIKGVLRACENDSDYERALEILRILQSYEENNSDWKIVGESTENFLYENDAVETVSQTQIVDYDILSSVMDTCSTAGEHGLALLCTQTGDFSQMNESDYSKQSTMVDKLLANQPSLYHSTRLLNSTLVALEGLRCSIDAYSLYSRVESTHEDGIKEMVRLPKSRIEMNTCWRETYHHIDRLLFAAHIINRTRHEISEEDKYNLSLGTALMLKCATESGQVNAGIEVAKTVASCVNQQKSKKSMKDTVKSLFGLEEIKTEPDITFWFSSDELFSATIAAHSIKYSVDDALATFFAKWDSTEFKQVSADGIGKGSWIKTPNTSLELLVGKGDLDQAHKLFDTLNRHSRTPDSYLIMANGYKKHERWNDVAICYFAAKKDGCLSEALCFLAMEGIAESTVSGKVKVLRSVANEAAIIKGVKTGAWIVDNYWVLKRHLGFHYARLLMWWNDPNETQQQEFRLASQHLSSSEKNNLRVDFDALKTIIALARHQEIGEKEDRIGNGNEHLHPPSVVYKALLEIHEADHNERSELLLKGMLYLSKTNSKTECAQYLEHIESNSISIDEQMLFLARTTAGFESI